LCGALIPGRPNESNYGMNDSEKQHARALIDRLIAEAQNDIEQKAYAQALTAIRKAKVLDITNIYMLALERQVEQLKELTSSGSLTDEQRNDILDSLPGIIEAAKSIQTPLATPETADAERRSTPEQLEQIRAARQWLRNQYFQRAHDHVKKQEYDRALAELRRVYVIDKEDLFAHEFELKITQMVELQKQKPPESAEVPPVGPGIQPVDTGRAAGGPDHQAAPSPDSTAGTSGAPSETSELSSPTSGLSSETPELSAETPDLLSQGTDAPSDQAGEDGTPSGEVSGKKNRLFLIALGIAIVVVAFAFYYFWKREQPAEPVLPPPSDETQQEVSNDEPMYSIPPALQIDTTKTDSTQADTRFMRRSPGTFERESFPLTRCVPPVRATLTPVWVVTCQLQRPSGRL
jgi:hypothetical protein